MPQVYKDRILKFLRHEEYQPLKLPQLARALGVGADAYAQFKTAFEELRRAGHVIIGGGNLITLPSMAGQVVGTFRANPKGFGFVCPLEPNAHGDLFIPPDSTGDAMNGDTVLAKVNRRGKRGPEVRYTGEILEVLERANNRFGGTLVRHPEAWIVQPDGNRFIEPIVAITRSSGPTSIDSGAPPRRQSMRRHPSAVATRVSPVTQGFEAWMRPSASSIARGPSCTPRTPRPPPFGPSPARDSGHRPCGAGRCCGCG